MIVHIYNVPVVSMMKGQKSTRVRPLELSKSMAYAHFAPTKYNVSRLGTQAFQINKQTVIIVFILSSRNRIVMLRETIYKFCHRERLSDCIALMRFLCKGSSSNCVTLARATTLLLQETPLNSGALPGRNSEKKALHCLQRRAPTLPLPSAQEQLCRSQETLPFATPLSSTC